MYSLFDSNCLLQTHFFIAFLTVHLLRDTNNQTIPWSHFRRIMSHCFYSHKMGAEKPSGVLCAPFRHGGDRDCV